MVPKRGEPHGRLQGATNLHRSQRSKPSESGGTTRTERVRKVASPGRRSLPRPVSLSALRGLFRAGSSPERGSGQEWTLSAHVDGGAIIDNPKRGVPILTGSQVPKSRGRKVSMKRRRGDEEGEGPHVLESISEGEAKVTRARPLVARPHGASRQEAPRRSAAHSIERGARPRRARGEGQRSATCMGAGDTAL
jgi:hypothetical protein